MGVTIPSRKEGHGAAQDGVGNGRGPAVQTAAKPSPYGVAQTYERPAAKPTVVDSYAYGIGTVPLRERRLRCHAVQA